MKASSATTLTILALITCITSACTLRTSDLSNQSRFSYPNGDYSALGHVSAEKSYFTSSFSVPEMDRQKFTELQQEALAQQPGADFIVNYMVSSSVTSVPIIPIAWTTLRLEGTAIKVATVGGQIYSHGDRRSPEQGK